MTERCRFHACAKRAIYIAGAATGIAILSPALAWIGLAVVAAQGKPIFQQQRPGLHRKPFTILKVRRMRVPRAGEAWYLTDDERITRLGRLLRASSLDELPELWNVLRGDMGLVGPRPLLMDYLTAHPPDEQHRYDMRPGMTGLAVVNRRNLLRIADRLAFDMWYVDHWIALNLRILFITVTQVVRRQGVTATEDMTLGFPLPGIDAAPRARPAVTTPVAKPPVDQGRD